MDIFGMGTRHGLSSFEQIAILGVIITAFISLIYAWLLRGRVLSKDKGTPKMRRCGRRSASALKATSHAS